VAVDNAPSIKRPSGLVVEQCVVVVLAALFTRAKLYWSTVEEDQV